MNFVTRRVLSLAVLSVLMMAALTANSPAQTTDISSSPSSLTFPNTYVGKVSGSKSITITQATSTTVVTFEPGVCLSRHGIHGDSQCDWHRWAEPVGRPGDLYRRLHQRDGGRMHGKCDVWR